MKRIFILGLAATLFAGCATEYSESVGGVSTMKSYEGMGDWSADSAAPAPAALMAASMRSSNSTVQEIMAPEGRKMMFTADYYITVTSVDDAQSAAKKFLEEAGGYIQSITDNYMVMRIPVKRANDALDMIASLGTVNSRSVSGQDVTEEMVDVQIRLDNLEILRTRLKALAEQDGKVEQLLQVERELARVTTEIESIKGRLQFLTNRIDYVTVNVRFNAKLPEAELRRNIPVAWVAALGNELANDVPTSVRARRLAFDVTLPDGFAIAYFSKKPRVSYAISANEEVIKLSRQRNLKNATITFWRDLIRRALSESANIHVTIDEQITTDEGFTGYILGGERVINSFAFGYKVLVIERCNTIYIYEYWAPLAIFGERADVIMRSFKSVDLSFWR